MTKRLPLNVAVIGCGIFARSQHIPNVLACPLTRLAACCDLDEAALSSLAAAYPGLRTTTDFHELVRDPEIDLIIVATTERFRIPIYEAAAAAGKPVLAEKPIAASLAEARHTAALVASSGIPFCAGHNRRCSPAMIEARELFRSQMENPTSCPWRFRREGWEKVRSIAGGEQGNAMVSIRINDDWMSWKDVHLQGDNAEYGLLLSEMTHFADLACWFLASRPCRVGVLSSGVLNHATIIEFENGDLASINMASNGTFGYPKELLEAFGNGAAVVVDHMLEIRTSGIEGAPARRVYPFLADRHPEIGAEGGFPGWIAKKQVACEEASRAGDPMLAFTAEPDKGHARMLTEFVREIRGERATPVSPVSEALLATEICAAAIVSFRENRFVNLSEL